MGGEGSGRKRKVGRPRIHPVGWKGHKHRGRPRRVGRPNGIHTKWGHGKKHRKQKFGEIKYPRKKIHHMGHRKHHKNRR